MNNRKRKKIQAWIDKQMKKGVKQNKRQTEPAMTNNYGRIIKTK